MTYEVIWEKLNGEQFSVLSIPTVEEAADILKQEALRLEEQDGGFTWIQVKPES